MTPSAADEPTGMCSALRDTASKMDNTFEEMTFFGQILQGIFRQAFLADNDDL